MQLYLLSRCSLNMSLRNSPSPSTHGRILLVDDNANGLSARKTVLEEIGHKIAAVSSGSDALDHFSKQTDLEVVTDYRRCRAWTVSS